MIILIVLNMGTIIVVLSNILIGQLSSRYTIAQEQAEIRYSIDKAKYITKVEKGRFKWMVRAYMGQNDKIVLARISFNELFCSCL